MISIILYIGQFSQPLDKRQPYETDIRVPLIVRGPGVNAQVTKSVPTVNVDIAPTILKIAGLNLPEDMDGFPLPIFNDSKYENIGPSIETNEVQTPEKYDRQILIEYHGEGSYDSLSKCPWSNDTNLFVSGIFFFYIANSCAYLQSFQYLSIGMF